jgi:hypothetical protein
LKIKLADKELRFFLVFDKELNISSFYFLHGKNEGFEGDCKEHSRNFTNGKKRGLSNISNRYSIWAGM